MTEKTEIHVCSAHGNYYGEDCPSCEDGVITVDPQADGNHYVLTTEQRDYLVAREAIYPCGMGCEGGNVYHANLGFDNIAWLNDELEKVLLPTIEG